MWRRMWAMTPARRGRESRAARDAARAAGGACLAQPGAWHGRRRISMAQPQGVVTADAAVARAAGPRLRGDGGGLPARAVRQPRWPAHRRRACGLARARRGRARTDCGRDGCAAARTTAWLGPAISQEHFEVGDEVREAFVECGSGAADRDSRRTRADDGRRISPGSRAAGWRRWASRMSAAGSGARSRIASGSIRTGAIGRRAAEWRRSSGATDLRARIPAL